MNSLVEQVALAARATLGAIRDRVVDAVGARRVLQVGGLVAALGFGTTLAFASQTLALCGFMLVGFGAANIIPLMFKAAGMQTLMPANMAVAAVTTHFPMEAI
ncbi:hypothetical protein [Mesorhizobium sp. M1D.F.Ca.ET.043.01.1.1]|uniref:hypothetical protein n=1 Tax=Mesorhizobium sp. M1D.F.Ca.ET.043.01.1.1 TaxID=2493669 RepID=UPI000F751296|nr:hypothetical protein [Mesorhizobium sp. M1D.F.Ca.ET.043.01.1.1]AZO69958.1 hypothetical protein EJ067_01230 [Mesorhizobium sp. M1D.F.Ca.ET.043.01.1.1]